MDLQSKVFLQIMKDLFVLHHRGLYEWESANLHCSSLQ